MNSGAHLYLINYHPAVIMCGPVGGRTNCTLMRKDQVYYELGGSGPVHIQVTYYIAVALKESN